MRLRWKRVVCEIGLESDSSVGEYRWTRCMQAVSGRAPAEGVRSVAQGGTQASFFAEKMERAYDVRGLKKQGTGAYAWQGKAAAKIHAFRKNRREMHPGSLSIWQVPGAGKR